jgi:hypothetical protein
MSAYQKALESAAELGEAADDMIAEVKNELAQELAAEEAMAASAAGATTAATDGPGDPRDTESAAAGDQAESVGESKDR